MTSHSRSRSRTWSSSTRRASQKLPRRDSVNPMNQPLAQKRAHIRRQLRQVFVYPLVYIVMWLVPFVALCVTYNDRYASRPPFLLNTFSNFCLCFIGAVNAIAFSFREKPWRHIPQNYNRSFWGSFCFWRRLDEDDEDYRSHRRRHSSINSKRWSESTYVDSTAPTTTKTQRDDPAPLAPAPPPPAALLSRSSTAPPPNTVNAVAADDVDSIQPISPRCNDPVSPTYPPALHPRTSYAPPFASRQDRGSASTARHPSASSPSASIGALARRSVASSLKRATAMAEAAAVGVRETDGQRAARELAYERLAWEREETARAGRTGSGVTMDAGEARRGSTGEIGVGKEWWERRRGSVWMGEGGEGGEQERRL
ncbi:glucose receptor git3 [Neofusicoccum parvum]|nr:glucose receptor git3 [Neofusicoccum parvum]